MSKLWLVDYDDTLAPNLHDYTESILTFAKYVVDTLGYKAPPVPTIINIEDKTDHEHVEKIDPETGKPFKFTARRFPTSMVESFVYIAEGVEIGGEPFQVTEQHRKEVWDIGMLAFNEERYQRQGLLPGVAETLDFLAQTGDELRLVTKGEPWVQERKLRATNMQHWFGDNIRIVTQKDESVLLEEAKGYDLRDVWHVGNSIKSDVIPAAKAGVGIIYVPLETWTHERTHGGKPDYARLVEVPRFSDIKRIYPSLADK